MANSLMELYGGGMIGKSNNYQLGGRIAKGKRDRAKSGELRVLREQKELADKRKARTNFWGKLVQTAGDMFMPGSGSLLRAGVESQYDKVDYTPGRYTESLAEDLRKEEDAFKSGIAERALVGGVKSYLMGDMYKKMGEDFSKGFGKLRAKFKGAGDSATQAGTGLYSTTPAPLDIQTGMGGNILSQPVSEFGTGDKGLGLLGLKDTAPAVSRNLTGSFAPLGGRQAVADAGKLAMPIRPDVSFAPQEFNLDNFGDMALSDINIPETQLSNLTMADLPSRSFNAYRALGGYGPFAGGGLIDYTIPKMQGGGMTSQHGYGGVSADRMGAQYGYGTATDVTGAMKQMGMAGLTYDPRFQKYMEDLPQWGMGYEQQLGDVKTGAQQNLMGLAAPSAPAATTFAGAGAPALAQQQARQNIMKQYGSQRRGIVEGYHADVLSAVRDIEREGDFEFQSPWKAAGMTEQEWRSKTRAEQDRLAADAEQLYSSEGNYGLQDWTQNTTGSQSGTTGQSGTSGWIGG